jgi:uncharacterized repeat protein (TIGR01451 family)
MNTTIHRFNHVAILMVLVATMAMSWPARSARLQDAVGSLNAPDDVSPAAPAPHADAAVLKSYGRLPLRFEANRGQMSERVRFAARADGYSLFLTRRGAIMSLPPARSAAGSPTQVKMRLVGMNPDARVKGIDRLSGATNYLIGDDPDRWRTGIPAYGRVLYDDVYPGIDMIFRGRGPRVEYDFVVAPGADPARIALVFKGTDDVSVRSDGALELRTGAGHIRQHPPVLYQKIRGRRSSVEGNVALEGDRISFRVGAYDPTRPLIIDPVLEYSSYLGGSSTEHAFGIAVDSLGSAYVTGFTFSDDFPEVNSAQGFQSGQDAFVTKLSPDGSSLVYSTYLGGSTGDEEGAGIAVDSSGSAYVVGNTDATDFPTVAAVQPAYGGDFDAFVTKLSPDGSSFSYSTYLGGSGVDAGSGIDLDPADSAYVTGSTTSDDFPMVGAVQATRAGQLDAFVTKIDPPGSSIGYSTYLGGTGHDSALDVAVGSSSSVYVTGGSHSSDFPVASPVQATNSGGRDAFVSSLDPSAASLNYSTYLGGGGLDEGRGLAVDGSGSAYVAGATFSGNFPTANAAHQAFAGSGDAFALKLAAGGGSLSFSTYLGGSGEDQGFGVALDSSANAYVVGTTRSDDFPSAYSAYPRGGLNDAFVTQLDPVGAVVYAQWLGGGDQEAGRAVASDGQGNAYVTGFSQSSDFPTVNPAQPTLASRPDAFVSKVGAFPGSRWSPTEGKLNRPRFSHSATLLENGRVLVAGGCLDPHEAHRGGCPETTSTAELFDIPSAGWNRTGRMNVARLDHTATLLTGNGCADKCGNVLVVGGCVTTAQCPPGTSVAELYDPDSGTFSLTGPTAAPRLYHTATLLTGPGCADKCGKLLVAGGSPNATVAELYNPATGLFTPTGAMSTPRQLHTATLLADGRVLIAGGRRSATTLTTAEIYNPATGAFTPTTGSMRAARAEHTATLLGGGDVLIAGGVGSLSSAEVFDPDPASFTTTGSMASPRANHTATLLPDGSVLVAGGRTTTRSGAISGAERFADGAWIPADNMVKNRSGNTEDARGHTATLLSANPSRFVSEPAFCGDHCGKVLEVGGTSFPVTEMFTAPLGVDLAVMKSDDTDPAIQGEVLTYNIVVLNHGAEGASAVTVTDRLPVGTAFSSTSSTQGSCMPDGMVVTCALGALSAGGEAVVQITVTTVATGVISNSVEVAAAEDDRDTGNNTDVEVTTVVSPVTGGCSITGTSGDDVLVGTPERDVICGLGGRDTIAGGGGDDTLIGGADSDSISGERDRDDIDGGSGDDRLNGGEGKDDVDGGLGSDFLKGENGADLLVGKDGVAANDVLDGGLGKDACDGDAGDLISNCP